PEPACAQGVLLRAATADLRLERRHVLVHPPAAHLAQDVDETGAVHVERAASSRAQAARAVVAAVEADRAPAAADRCAASPVAIVDGGLDHGTPPGSIAPPRKRLSAISVPRRATGRGAQGSAERHARPQELRPPSGEANPLRAARFLPSGRGVWESDLAALH